MSTASRLMFWAAGAVSGAIAMAATASAQVKWNLPAAYPPTNYHSENLAQFAKDVSAATNGKLDITVHAGASLFKAPEIKRAVATGQAQIGEVLISIHENEYAIYGIDVLPFLATSFPDSRRLWNLSRQLIEKKLASQNLKVLFAVPWGPQGIYVNKDLNSLADMKGLKFRAYNAGTSRIAELAGAQPVTIQVAELPQALATGVVNSMITSGSTGYDSKVWESLSHWYDTKAWIPKNLTFVNKRAFDALDNDTREAVLRAAGQAEERGWRTAEEKAVWYVEQLKKNGMKVEPPNAQFAAELKKVGEQLVSDWLKKAGDEGKQLVDAYNNKQ